MSDLFQDTTDRSKDQLREVLALSRRPRNNETTVACPRLIRPGLTEIPCEVDLRIAVGGSSREGTWVDDYEAPCGHVLTDVEEGLVLDAALDDLDRRADDDRADSYDRDGRV